MGSPVQFLRRLGVDVPQLPDKLFFTIREVSEYCGVEPHVLRYWETEFPNIKPVKKSGNRRFYRQRDVYNILYIKHLLYDLNFTIKGARKRLQGGDIEALVGQNGALETLRSIRKDLMDVIDLLGD